MAAPNIVNVTSIIGKSATLALTTSAQTLLNNAASSGKVLKINSLYVANIDGGNAADVTVNYYPQDDITGTAVAIASTISVPADSTLVIIDKNATIYLEEDRSLGALASANSDLVAVISYEEIS
jgi:predicted secreted protein